MATVFTPLSSQESPLGTVLCAPEIAPRHLLRAPHCGPPCVLLMDNVKHHSMPLRVRQKHTGPPRRSPTCSSNNVHAPSVFTNIQQGISCVLQKLCPGTPHGTRNYVPVPAVYTRSYLWAPPCSNQKTRSSTSRCPINCVLAPPSVHQKPYLHPHSGCGDRLCGPPCVCQKACWCAAPYPVNT